MVRFWPQQSCFLCLCMLLLSLLSCTAGGPIQAAVFCSRGTLCSWQGRLQRSRSTFCNEGGPCGSLTPPLSCNLQHRKQGCSGPSSVGGTPAAPSQGAICSACTASPPSFSSAGKACFLFSDAGSTSAMPLS